jgi:hypothetical protein
LEERIMVDTKKVTKTIFLGTLEDWLLECNPIFKKKVK